METRRVANPPALSQVMEATGSRFSSSVTVGNALSRLPHRQTCGRGTRAETNTFEFPITVEDELLPLMGLRIKQSLALARKIGRDGRLFAVLIHPNILGHKLDFARILIDELRGEAWFGALEDFGGRWAARNAVSLDTERDREGAVPTLAAPQPISGPALEIPVNWSLEGADRLVRQAGRIEAARVRAQQVERGTLNAASVLRKAGKFREAEAIYRGLLAAGSVSAFQGKTRFADARRDFEAALTAAPTADDATLGLARVDLHENRLDDAQSRIDRVLAKQPENTEARALAARVALARGEAEEAEVAFRALSLRLPGDTDVLLGLGDALRGTMQDDEARTVYAQAGVADPASAEIQARVAQKIRPRRRLDLDGPLSTLTKGNTDWKEGNVHLSYQLSERTALSGGIEITERFGPVALTAASVS